MAQAPVGRPLHEGDLRDELGLDPRRRARDALLRLEGGRVAHERPQACGQPAQGRAREARPHLARIQEAVAPASVASARRETWADIASVSIACLAFFFICTHQLDLPGLYNDEAFDVIPAMQVVLGHPVELQRGAGIDLFGVTLPLMSSSDYQGITSTYLAIPFFAIGGVNV